MNEQTIRCPRCGMEVPAGSRFCPNCGFDLAAPPAPVAPAPPPGPVPAAPVPPYAGPSAAEARQRVAQIVNNRTATDERISELWVVLPLIAAVAALAVGFAALFLDPGFAFTIFLAGWIIAAILIIVLNYKLIKRQNDHMAREAALRRAIIDYQRAKGQERGVTNAITPYLTAMEMTDRDFMVNEQQRSPLWSLGLLVPIVGFILFFYMLWFLTKFTSEHDRRWYAFAFNAHLASMQLGDNVPPPAQRPWHERSFLLYLIITILLSVFLIYWYYVLIKDVNEHFDYEWSFEDYFMQGTQA